MEQVSWAFLVIPLIWSKKGTDLESILIAVFFTSSYVSRSSLVVSQLHLFTTRLDSTADGDGATVRDAKYKEREREKERELSKLVNDGRLGITIVAF